MPIFGLNAGISIIDQTLISGSSFVLNILLARWLLPEDYGVFAVVFSIFLFFSGFHNALIIEPMSVLGPNQCHEQRNDYIIHTIWLHSILSVGLFILLLFSGIGLKITNYPIGNTLIGLAFAIPFILLFWLLRRACFLDGRANLAMRGSLLYCFLLFVGLWAMWQTGAVNPLNGILILGISSMGASIGLLHLLEINARALVFGYSKATLAGIFIKNFSYGKWVVGSSFVHWAGTAGYLPLIGGLVGFSQAGALRAIQNLILPLQQVLAGLANLWLPLNAKTLIEQGKESLKRNLKKMIIVTCAFSMPYLIGIVVFSENIINFLYGSGRYDQFQWLTYYLVVFAIFGVVSQGLSIALKALQRPDCVFYSQTGTAILTGTVGCFLVWKWELEGAAIGLILSALMGTLILFSLFQVSFKKA